MKSFRHKLVNLLFPPRRHFKTFGPLRGNFFVAFYSKGYCVSLFSLVERTSGERFLLLRRGMAINKDFS